MAKILLQTISSVHIGSGKDLMRNTEFLVKGGQIGIVDDKKVIDIIGTENIDKWVNIINNNESLFDYLEQRKNDIELEDVSNRIMSFYCNDIASKQSLKEQLHSAKLLPMIPGSSLKGAIRTAVITKLVNDNTNNVKDIIEKQKSFYKSKNSKWKWNLRDFQKTEDAILNTLLSGFYKADANHNTFRFLQVSDFIFNYNTIASNMQVVNFYQNKWNVKNGSDQLVEMIAPESEAEGRIQINTKLLEQNRKRNEIKTNISFLRHIEELFKIINEHTESLVNKEIELWKEDKYSKPASLENYIENMDNIKEQINNCDKKEAIIRIGGGSGWDFITGAWAKTNEKLFDEEEYDILVSLLNKRRDVEYFPKTRKIDENGDMLGFVKMRIV